ncbi:MAG: (d)CMP kinase, partial [Veillonella dispar]|nr:(d)CMP kinase [Veillonella dispar]
YKGVREYLVERQQAMAAVGGVILDGRDIGSVVLPKAELKIYLTASVDARAKRRWLEVQGTSNEQSLEDIKNNVESRDEMDKNRDESPLVCVEDAIVVDSSNMTFDETVEHILHLVQERI